MFRSGITPAALAFLPLFLVLPFDAGAISRPARHMLDKESQLVRVNNSGNLREGWHSDQNIRLTYGTEYVMSGVCDEDCSDLDLKLFDSSGNLIAQDVDPDDTPIIVHTARYTGNYTLRVIMARCAIEPCAWRSAVTP